VSVPAARVSSWRQLALTGRYADALSAAEADNFDAICGRESSVDLLLLADTAHFAGSGARAEQAFRAVRNRFAGGHEAAVAAFSLGRMAYDERHDYRDSAADPLNGHGDPRAVTGNTWAAPPASWPEDSFVGEGYNGFLAPDAPAGALRVTDTAAWIFAGTGLRDGQSVTPEDLYAHCQTRLAKFKWPRYFGFRPAFPLTPSGKVAKHEIKKTTPDLLLGAFDVQTSRWLPGG